MQFEKNGLAVEVSNVFKNNIGGISFNVTIGNTTHMGHFTKKDSNIIEFIPAKTFPAIGRPIGGIGITSAQHNQILAEVTTPKPQAVDVEALRARLKQIAIEAKSAKSDAVLHGLAAERRGIMEQIGTKCEGCGEYFLPEHIKYGVCKLCYTEGRIDY